MVEKVPVPEKASATKYWAIVPLGLAMMLWQAWVLSVLWGWFAVPAFGVHGIHWLTMLGLVQIYRCLRGVDPYTPAAKDWTKIFSYQFAGPLIFLAFGWIVVHLQ